MIIDGVNHPSTTKYIDYLYGKNYKENDIIECLVSKWGVKRFVALNILEYYNKNYKEK